MAVICATTGAAEWDGSTIIPDVRSISLEENANPNEFGSSHTAGETARKCGRKDFTGSMDCYVASKADLPFSEGSTGTLKLVSDQSTIILNEAVYIISIGTEVPIEDGGLVSVSVEFGQNKASVAPSIPTGS